MRFACLVRPELKSLHISSLRTEPLYKYQGALETPSRYFMIYFKYILSALSMPPDPSNSPSIPKSGATTVYATASFNVNSTRHNLHRQRSLSRSEYFSSLLLYGYSLRVIVMAGIPFLPYAICSNGTNESSCFASYMPFSTTSVR